MKRYLVLLPALGLLAMTLPGFRPANASADPAAGVACEFVAKLLQSGESVTTFGYLTHVDGLADASLFASATVRTEATARFKFHATTTLTSHHSVGNILTSGADGELPIWFDAAGGASFDDPPTFKTGKKIATFRARFHTVNNVQSPLSATSPGRGIVTLTAELEQTDADDFKLDGRNTRFGHKGINAHMAALAQGTLTANPPVQAFLFLGGNLIETK